MTLKDFAIPKKVNFLLTVGCNAVNANSLVTCNKVKNVFTKSEDHMLEKQGRQILKNLVKCVDQ